MARSSYKVQKRQKELARKQKKEERKQARQYAKQNKSEEDLEASPSEEELE
jgi:hypothetical protein